jgi:hypothetical protein
VTSKRTPIKRGRKPSAPTITPKAIALFREWVAVACTCAPRDWHGEHWRHRRCAGCEHRLGLHDQLIDELGIRPTKPWQDIWITFPRRGLPVSRRPRSGEELETRSQGPKALSLAAARGRKRHRMSTAADRKRLYRQRQKHHRAVLPIPVEYFGLCEALVASGRLTEAEALDRYKVRETPSRA